MGCAIAAELARAGCVVQIFEKAIPGAEASSAAAGILGAGAEATHAGPLLQLCQASQAMWPGFAQDLLHRTGLSIGMQACGAVELGRSADDMAQLRAKSQWLGASVPDLALLDGQQVHQLVDGLGDDVIGALWHPSDGQVEPPLLVRALARDAELTGATLITGRPIEGIVVASGRVHGVQAGGLFPADHVVVAAGAWTDLVPGLAARRTSIRPLHGQLAELLLPAPPCIPVLAWRGGYVVPRADGRVVVGATSEDTGFDKRMTAGGLHHLLAMAISAVPALAQATVVRHWAGLRPQSLDGLPLMGPYLPVAGLHFAAGHHRNGILLTPVTARLIASSVLGAPWPTAWNSLLPAPTAC